ncbi:MAG: hypothetical protein KGZ30_01715 [Anaplasmataceae bacterium]|nr:hypothetical protein [Anaplasmataceae bacterium]
MPNFFPNNPEAAFALNILRFIFILIDLGLFIGVIYVLRNLWQLRPPLYLNLEPGRRVYTLGQAVVVERWERVMKKFATGTREGIALAIIEADKVVDDVLKSLGLEGEHMADRLGQLSPDELRSFDRVWRAHRLRNEVVHSPDYYLTTAEAERALDDFENFLKEVQALPE